MVYELRLSFDAGSGICLWAVNESARSQFGYPVDHWKLPVSDNTKRWFQHLVSWFDTSLDWSAPGDTDSRWSEEELQQFQRAVQQGLSMLRQELSATQFHVHAATAA
jgi:hypothetical protein